MRKSRPKLPNTRLCWVKPEFPWGLDTTGNLDYAGRMTTFGNATTADFDRYAERSFYRDEARYQQAMAEAEAAAEAAEEEAEYTDPERFVSEADYNAPTAQDREDLQTVLDWEAFEGFGS